MNWRVEVLKEEIVLQARAGKKQSSMPHIIVVGQLPTRPQGPSSRLGFGGGLPAG